MKRKTAFNLTSPLAERRGALEADGDENGAALRRLEGKKARKKWPVPEGVICWRSLERHPLNGAIGREVKSQRDRRGWSLDDLHDSTRIAKSHLSDLERGKHNISLDMIMALEGAFGMVEGGLLKLACRRLKRERLRSERGRSI